MGTFSKFFMIATIASFNVHGAEILLNDWAFNLEGTTYEAYWGDVLPDYVDDSRFNWETGLGTLTIDYTSEASGTYSFLSFFDHEIDEEIALWNKEMGAVVGTDVKPEDLVWEIDDAGWDGGDIYWNVLDGYLENSNDIPENTVGDISMGLGWNLYLEEGENVFIDFILSDLGPTGSFYLAHSDPLSTDNNTIYFSSAVRTESVPEPTVFHMFFVGLASIGLLSRRKKLK
jgi:hypothetical protein